MAGRRGLFGLSRFKIFPDRSKFDPDLHPDHAPWVPEEKLDDYYKLVRARTARLGSGKSSATAQKHTRDGKGWVSFGTAHAGIAFEWGSYAMPRRLILSSSARKFSADSRSAEAKKAAARRSNRARVDARGRLQRGLRLDLKMRMTGETDRKVVAQVRERLEAVLRQRLGPRNASDPLPLNLLQRLKAPMPEVEKAGGAVRRVVARLQRADSPIDLRNLAGQLTRE